MIYLDAGATTLEKPACVREAMARAVQTMTSPGRGGHSAVRLAEQTAFRCRSEAAALFGTARPEQVIFTQNATHGLNIAIRTLVRPGSRVAISGYEHNAVTRVLHSIPDVAVTVVDAPLFDPDAMAEGFAQALAQGADAAVCNHVSNVFGAVAPVAEIAALCRARGVPLIVDASQSAGVLEVNLTGWGAAFAAMPGHKGLYGPQGTGLLLCAAEAEPLLFGGTGSQSRRQEMPQDLPDRLEAGTHNMPGIAGLLEGIRFVRGLGTEEIARRERPPRIGAAARGAGGGGVRAGGLRAPDGRAVVSRARDGLRDARRAARGAGHRRARGAALRAAGAPDGGDARDGDGAHQPLRFHLRAAGGALRRGGSADCS